MVCEYSARSDRAAAQTRNVLRNARVMAQAALSRCRAASRSAGCRA
jgi:hypothetical protein